MYWRCSLWLRRFLLVFRVFFLSLLLENRELSSESEKLDLEELDEEEEEDEDDDGSESGFELGIVRNCGSDSFSWLLVEWGVVNIAR